MRIPQSFAGSFDLGSERATSILVPVRGSFRELGTIERTTERETLTGKGALNWGICCFGAWSGAGLRVQ